MIVAVTTMGSLVTSTTGSRPGSSIVAVNEISSRSSYFGGKFCVSRRALRASVSALFISNVTRAPLSPSPLTRKARVRSRTLRNGSSALTSTRCLMAPRKSTVRFLWYWNLQLSAKTEEGTSAPIGGSPPALAE
ncbi:hypothetical protein AQI88_38420 [Streptomyces cellostaticus]|uniref:Uncharacterized protein n=1 Tax=Streptomyces cellostaticus TaxID=67285 RepID=A0A101NDL6_9ACTN|nr:hypothetical protein AQI88_38420 [Streptomyces cellostaticus]